MQVLPSTSYLLPSPRGRPRLCCISLSPHATPSMADPCDPRASEGHRPARTLPQRPRNARMADELEKCFKEVTSTPCRRRRKSPPRHAADAARSPPTNSQIAPRPLWRLAHDRAVVIARGGGTRGSAVRSSRAARIAGSARPAPRASRRAACGTVGPCTRARPPARSAPRTPPVSR